MRPLQKLMNRGRPKKFDEISILESSMCLFWQEGYYQVSIRDIEKASKTKSQSLYNHFGDKEGLFVASIEHYLNTRVISLLNEANETSDPKQAITTIVQHFRDSAKQSKLSGCFLANAVVDLSLIHI